MPVSPYILEHCRTPLDPDQLPALPKETAWELMDRLEDAMLREGGDLNGAETQPLVHRFTPGLYTREILNPAGSLIVTKVHKTEHQFVLLEGTMSVWDFEHGWQTHTGPKVGATQPGTRRIIYAHTDCRFMTIHPTAPMGLGDQTLDESHLDAIEAALIEPRRVLTQPRPDAPRDQAIPETTNHGGVPSAGSQSPSGAALCSAP